MTVSGTISGFLVTRIHWIAELTKIGANRWEGTIWYKDGAVASFPYTDVEVRALGSHFPAGRKLKIKFTGVRRREADGHLQVPLQVLPHGQS